MNKKKTDDTSPYDRWDEVATCLLSPPKYSINLIWAAVKKIIIENDLDYYTKACLSTIELSKQLIVYLERHKITIEKIRGDETPSGNWQFIFNSIVDGNFVAHFQTTLTISKIVPIFELFHSFEVESPFKDTICSPIVYPTLDGGSFTPYSRDQCNFDEFVNRVFTDIGYFRTVYGSEENLIAIPHSFKKKHPHIKERYITLSSLFYDDILDLRKCSGIYKSMKSKNDKKK